MNSTSSYVTTINGNTIECIINGERYEEVHEITIKSTLMPVVNLPPMRGDLTFFLQGVVQTISTASGAIKVEGNVEKNVRNVSGRMHIEGNVGGDVRNVSGNITVGGNLYGKASSVSGSIKASQKK